MPRRHGDKIDHAYNEEIGYEYMKHATGAKRGKTSMC